MEPTLGDGNTTYKIEKNERNVAPYLKKKKNPASNVHFYVLALF